MLTCTNAYCGTLPEGMHHVSCSVHHVSRRVVLSFQGTSREFTRFLAQLTTLVADESYDWELTASVARHPAGKRLGVVSDQSAGPDLSTCPHGFITASCTTCNPHPRSTCGNGHDPFGTEPCSGELWCPNDDACALCGTIAPHGGLIKATGIPGAQICAYSLGCTPGKRRPDNG